ncbi:uncharacterized protein [Ptychodera flava]|uniref:uncharacterized protein isoform X1 n=1 Tax=Ptychodera flava TaxID=63121 RepID=UPI00396A344C
MQTIVDMDIEEAKSEFQHLFGRVELADRKQFLRWIEENFNEDDGPSNEDIIIQSIAESLRSELPINGLVNNEQIKHDGIDQNSGSNDQCTIHVDKFLYDDDTVDDLCNRGQLSQNYCLDCKSHNTAPLSFISHSCSIVQLKFIFQHVLPDIKYKTVIDIGSRLGAVLYGTYYYSDAANIIGIEFNEEFCRLQQKMVDVYQLHDRIKIICADVCTQKMLLQQADVVVLNNVFEFFASVEDQTKIWRFLAESIQRKGCYLVTVPSLEQSLQCLQTGINVKSWVKSIPLDYNAAASAIGIEENDLDEIQQIFLYQVL